MNKEFINIYIPLGISLFLFLIIHSFFFNGPVDLRDEGFLNFNAYLINNGQIPYRDFFLTTTPGSFYIQSLLLTAFGNNLIIGRLLYGLLSILIIILSAKTFKLRLFEKYLFLISLAVILSGGTFAFYNIEGIFLAILSFFIFTKSKKKGLFIVGFLCGLTFLVKQSYAFALLPMYLFLIFYSHNERAKRILYFIVGLSTPLVVAMAYLAFHSALQHAVYYVFIFASIVKSHRTSFIQTLIISVLVYFLFLRFFSFKSLRKNTVLFFLFSPTIIIIYFVLSPDRLNRVSSILQDPLVYYYLLLITLPLTIIGIHIMNRIRVERRFFSYTCLSFVLFAASAASGRDLITVQLVSPFFLPVLLISIRYIKFIPADLYKSFLIIICFLYALPFTINHINRFYDYQSLQTHPHVATLSLIRMPKDETQELATVLSYIKTHTSQNDTILCFPYCPLINFLSQRDSPSFFSFFYKETFLESDQNKVVADIKTAKPLLFVMQKKGTIEKEAEEENLRLQKLKNFLENNATEVIETKNFRILRTNF